MKRIIPIFAFCSLAMTGMAQNDLGSGLNTGDLDKSVRPQDDFYQYACGGWMQSHPLPAAYSRYGSFDKLGEDNVKRINGILNELKTNEYAEGTTERKLSDLYKLATDEQRRAKDGVSPIMPMLNRIQAAKDIKSLIALQMEMTSYTSNEFYALYFGADRKNSSQNIANVYQGGLILRQKEYYLDNDSSTADIREAYKAHIVNMFKFFGFSENASCKKMQNIIRLETELAKVSRTNSELRDPESNYHKMTLKEFNARYPHLYMEQIANAGGVESKYLQEVVVGQPEFLDGADKLMATLKTEELCDYMQWRQILSAVGYLNEDAIAANFEFFGKKMSGRKEDHPLWKRATSQVESQMGEALGKIYTDKYFPESSKTRMVQLVKNLQISLGERIQAQTWMSEETKKNAMDKLNSFYVKIGYPDKWTDMSKLVIDTKKSYYENIIECKKFWNAYEISKKAGKPVDKDEWHMTPQTVNAYYNPTTNEICFPAGILQPPFFDATADDAFNYGAIGVVIGHEMTHGFDDSGRHYDKDGNMNEWWTKEDAANFTKRADVCVNFFSNIKVLPDLNANGKFTLGENLADHGGLMVSFNAFKNATKSSPCGNKDGLTAEQRFFLAYSGVWAGNITEAEIRNRTKSDPHSLGRWRVNGTLPHIDAWYEAFDVKEGDPLFVPKAERLDLW